MNQQYATYGISCQDGQIRRTGPRCLLNESSGEGSPQDGCCSHARSSLRDSFESAELS